MPSFPAPCAPESTKYRLVALLEKARRTSGVAAIVLADDQGLLIAGAGPYAQCEALAAWAPLSRTRGRVASTELWGRRIHLATTSPESLAPAADGLLSEARFTLAPGMRWVA